jgi:WD40 repeat protein
MKRSILPLLLVFWSAVALSGCDSSPNVLTQQEINELQWMPDGSGLLAVILQISQDVTTGNQIAQAQLFRVSASGTIGSAFNIPDKSLPYGYPTIIAISKDNRTAITQLGTTVYRVDLNANTALAMVKTQYLMGASQSLKYALVTQTDAAQRTRFASIYDVSGSTARKVKDFTMNGVYGTRAIWLGDSIFCIWGFDSVGYSQTQFYDTTGRVVHTLQTSVPPNNLAAFASDANALFLWNSASQGIDRYDLSTGATKTILSNDSVETMDVTPSGNLVAYSSGGSVVPFALYALNPINGNRANIGSSAYEVALSPLGDKVAYSTVESGLKAVNIRVVPISIP